MTPLEERLVLELHSKWGNRWSRIARKLPGRTDNEIKNYWRTHMRKKAQERKKAMCNQNNHHTTTRSSSSSSSLSSGGGSSSSSSCSDKGKVMTTMITMATNTNLKTVGSVIANDDDQTKGRNFYDTGGFELSAPTVVAGGNDSNKDEVNRESGVKVYSQDEIWDDIETLSEDDVMKPVQSCGGNGGDGENNLDYYTCHDQEFCTVGSCSPVWDYFPVSPWLTGQNHGEGISNNYYNYNSFYNNNNQDYMMSNNFKDDSAGVLQVLI